jgi:hypothetical protein
LRDTTGNIIQLKKVYKTMGDVIRNIIQLKE